MLDRIKAGDLKGAKALLDWLREDSHLEGGDDPLGGAIFPRFWIKGEAADARKMKLAAAAIMVGTKPTAAQGVAMLEEALKDASGERENGPISNWRWRMDTRCRTTLPGCWRSPRRCSSRSRSRSWLSSTTCRRCMGLGRYDEAIALADQRLKLLDGDPTPWR